MNETIVFCFPGKMFSNKFMKSWTETIIWCRENNINVVVKWETSANVFDVRNRCFGGIPEKGIEQKPFQGKIKYNYIMMFDSDQTWYVDDFKRILTIMRENSNIDALTGVYPQVTDAKNKYTTLMKLVKNNNITLSYKLISFDELNDMPTLSKVDGAGLGFCMIRNGVIEKLEYPWFTAIPIMDVKTNKTVYYTSEDLAIWLKLKNVGVNLWCDKKIRIGHEKMRVFY